MAKLKQGILGPISGKIGPVVGGVWKGIPYIRRTPKKKKKKAPRTPGRVANEKKFKFGNDWLIPFHPYMTIGFQNEAVQRTALSAAFSANYKHVFKGKYPDLQIDYSAVKISVGTLPGLTDPQLALTAPDTLLLTWKASSSAKAIFNDQIMLVVYSPALAKTDGFIGSTLRRDLQYAFKFNPELIGTDLEVYLSVTSLDRKKIAESKYMGRILPL